MSLPLRKDQPELLDEEITTADLAQGRRPVLQDRPMPVLAERSPNLRQDAVDQPEVEDTRTKQASIENNAGQRPNEASNPSLRIMHSSAQPSADSTPLFPGDELEELRSRWSEVQTAFVDEPRKAVEQADSLVASAMKRLAEVFAEERSDLERQWDRGDNMSTEDLRIALQRYRTFFQPLLAV